MQRGKFILLLAIISATAVAAWQWVIEKALDKLASAAGGPMQRVGAVIAMFGPLQQFILGMSAGMVLAFIIGYWDRIQPVAYKTLMWIDYLLWLGWHSTPGGHVLLKSVIHFEPGERQVEIDISRYTFVVREVELPPGSDIRCSYATSETVRFDRTLRTGTPLDEPCTLRGYQLFLPTLFHWVATDYVGQRIAAAKASVPSPQSPQDTGSKTPS